jgi:putative effector of murein hydrolase
VTIAAQLAGGRIQRLCRGPPLANPVLIATLIVGAILLATGESYASYFAGAQFAHVLLGPATVALAVPLARSLHLVKRSLVPSSLALFAGTTTSILSGQALVRALGGGSILALSMAPKAATTPIAMAISQQIGGVPALTASQRASRAVVSPLPAPPRAINSRRPSQRWAWVSTGSSPRGRAAAGDVLEVKGAGFAGT